MASPEEVQVTARETEFIQVAKDGPVDWLTLNRPEQLNAITPAMAAELSDYFRSIAPSEQTRIVVIRGAGRAFCAGLDIVAASSVDEPSLNTAMIAQRRYSELIVGMRRCPQPIISLVHGPAAGLGFSIALASDVRIAGESARMNAAFVRVGFSGGDCGSSYHLPRLVGGTNAAELLLTGRFVDAERALRIGLVSEVVPDAELEAAGRSLAQDMARVAPLGLRLTKDLLNASAEGGSLEAAIALEDRSQVLCGASGDPAEGMRAFVDKRDPEYG